jgi:nicotinamidase-related amidase
MEHAALVVLDMQNDAISEEGAFGGTGAAAHAREQDVVANVAGLAAAFRAARLQSSTSGTSLSPAHRSSRRTQPSSNVGTEA